MSGANEGHPPSTCYAVFVRKHGKWAQQSVPFTDYGEAQEHAKLVRRCVAFIEKTRVRRLPHNAAGQGREAYPAPDCSVMCQGCAVNERRGEEWDPFHYGTRRPCDLCGTTEGLRALMPNMAVAKLGEG